MWESIAHFGFGIFLNILNSGNNVKDYVFEEDIVSLYLKHRIAEINRYLL